jgi:hypothetical protein
LASADTLNSPNITSAQARSQPTDIQRTPELHEENSSFCEPDGSRAAKDTSAIRHLPATSIGLNKVVHSTQWVVPVARIA